MILKACLVDSAFKHVRKQELRESFFDRPFLPITAVKNERFAFQMLVRTDRRCMCCLDETNYLNWDGLYDRVRIEMKASTPLVQDLQMRFEGYVPDDAGTLTADPILEVGNCSLDELVPQAVWVDGAVLPEFEGDEISIDFTFYHQAGFGDEERILTLSATVRVAPVVLPSLRENSVYHFYLWQHPSNWAKTFGVRLWGEDHFAVIENMLKELSSVGISTTTLVVSEFPWNGQMCCTEYEYPSDLYEHNIVKVYKGKDGRFWCNFDVMDRYLALCEKYHMCREIDLMGLIYIWAGVAEGQFAQGQVMNIKENAGKNAPGNPFDDYSDGVRIRYYDESDGLYKYMHKKAELGEYVRLLFYHFVEKGLWDRVSLFSDEPVDVEVCGKWMETIKGFVPELRVNIRLGVFNEEIIETYGEQEKNLVTHFSGVLCHREMVMKVKDQNRKRGGTFDWAICCTPDHPNTFIQSPLIEARLTSWMTYQMDMDGYENWKFAIWPSDPWNRVSYKDPSWLSGDMFYVYPNHNGKPCSSVRWENIRLGLQDYNLFRMLEEKGVFLREMRELYLDPVLTPFEEAKVEFDVYSTRPEIHFGYSRDYRDYENIRAKLIERLASFQID